MAKKSRLIAVELSSMANGATVSRSLVDGGANINHTYESNLRLHSVLVSGHTANTVNVSIYVDGSLAYKAEISWLVSDALRFENFVIEKGQLCHVVITNNSGSALSPYLAIETEVVD